MEVQKVRPLTLTEKILRLHVDHVSIHETNLKKQGVLPLTFKDPRDLTQAKPGKDNRSWPLGRKSR